MNKTHGMTNTKIYRQYRGVLSRCNNPNDSNYYLYGEKGIKVCSCIPDFITYYDYVSILDHYGEPEYTLDRINGNGNYCICTNNLRWASKSEQMQNQLKNRIDTNSMCGITKLKCADGSYSWNVRIKVLGQHVVVGTYKSYKDAVAARKQAEIDYWENWKQVEFDNNRLSLNNKSGVRGVSYNKRDKVWYMNLYVNGEKYKSIHKTFEEAAEARKQAEIKYRD